MSWVYNDTNCGHKSAFHGQIHYRNMKKNYSAVDVIKYIIWKTINIYFNYFLLFFHSEIGRESTFPTSLWSSNNCLGIIVMATVQWLSGHSGCHISLDWLENHDAQYGSEKEKNYSVVINLKNSSLSYTGCKFDHTLFLPYSLFYIFCEERVLSSCQCSSLVSNQSRKAFLDKRRWVSRNVQLFLLWMQLRAGEIQPFGWLIPGSRVWGCNFKLAQGFRRLHQNFWIFLWEAVKLYGFWKLEASGTSDCRNLSLSHFVFKLGMSQEHFSVYDWCQFLTLKKTTFC